MNDELSENATLHVLGLLTGDAREAFEHRLREDPVLREEVAALRDSLVALGRTAPAHPPPPELRAEILAGFASRAAQARGQENPAPGPAALLVPFPSQSAPPRPAAPPSGSVLMRFMPWAAAAALGVMFFQENRRTSALEQDSARLATTNQTLEEKQRHYLEAIQATESSKNRSEAELASTRAALETAAARLTELNRQNGIAAAELEALKEQSQLDRLKVKMMGSLLKNRPKALAVSVWNQDDQQGMLVVEDLPALPPGRDYQLWVIDPAYQTPVSAGVFKVDGNGNVRMSFTPAQPVREAANFAVTEETEGGSPTPHLDKLVVIGK